MIKKSRTLEDCDIQNIYKCLIYITVNFVGLVMTVELIEEIW